MGKTDKEILLEKIDILYETIKDARENLKENEKEFNNLIDLLKTWKVSVETSEKILLEYEQKVTKLVNELDSLEEKEN